MIRRRFAQLLALAVVLLAVAWTAPAQAADPVASYESDVEAVEAGTLDEALWAAGLDVEDIEMVVLADERLDEDAFFSYLIDFLYERGYEKADIALILEEAGFAPGLNKPKARLFQQSGWSLILQ